MSTFESRSESELEGELQEQELLIDGMLDAPALELYAPSAPARSRSIGKDGCYIPPPICRKQQLERTDVVVVGGGLAGLMAAMRLRQNGVRVTLFEARPQVGGRVLNNTTFSNGRIVEEGAELVGSFHNTWLGLARQFGLTVISRMESERYEQAGLDVRFRLGGRDLAKDKIKELSRQMEEKVLKPIARNASQIREASEPWADDTLMKYDDISVAYALENIYKVPRLENGQPNDLWEFIKIKLVNDEVAPLDKMNYLGLLCKVKAGQGERFGGGVYREGIGYWEELEIFRCTEGCQTLAKRIAENIQSVDKMLPPVKIRLRRAVTHIELSNRGAQVGHKGVIDPFRGILTPGEPAFTCCNYVILASPPCAWKEHAKVPRLTITAEGMPVDLFKNKAIGTIGMFPAVKFFSNMKERFWVKQKVAPYGGATELGQVWEGTDNQTQVEAQAIVLSAFAGPILDGAAPTPDKFRKELNLLFPDKEISGQLLAGYTRSVLKTLFANWPMRPFINTGYFSPKRNDIFDIAWMFNRKWSRIMGKPLHARLFFAGEHTDMGFFGYMEGALRSGIRAAEEVVREACGQPEPVAVRSSRASAASIRKTAV